MGTISTGKESILLEERRTIIGYDKDNSYLQKSMVIIVEVYTSQLLDKRSEWTCDDHERDSGHVNQATVESRRLRE